MLSMTLCASARADELNVSIRAHFFIDGSSVGLSLPPITQNFDASFEWNTVTDMVSDMDVHSSGFSNSFAFTEFLIQPPNEFTQGLSFVWYDQSNNEILVDFPSNLVAGKYDPIHINFDCNTDCPGGFRWLATGASQGSHASIVVTKVTDTPEPSTLALMLFALVVLCPIVRIKDDQGRFDFQKCV